MKESKRLQRELREGNKRKNEREKDEKEDDVKEDKKGRVLSSILRCI